MEKTADIKCPNCKSNNCEVIVQSGNTLGCKCNDCGSNFLVHDTDGTTTSDNK